MAAVQLSALSVGHRSIARTVGEQWENSGRHGVEPSRAFAGAIAAAADLIADPGQAGWVRRHWGDTYLQRGNLFYRMLLIAGLDSYERLSNDFTHRQLLQSQAEALGAELDRSPHGVVEDYPGQSYSVDVLLAYAAIARFHSRVGQVDPQWIARAQRAFSGNYIDSRTGLPAYLIDAESGASADWARGVGISMMLIHAHELWPDLGKTWYARHVENFWQERLGLAGFREYPASHPGTIDWGMDVDAGFVFAGFGTAASAFGLGATRVHGDTERAMSLTAQALLAAWPLANDTLLGPRLVSNLIDAPYTGEAALLYVLTRTSQVPGSPATGSVPLAILIILGVLAIVGIHGPIHVVWRLVRRGAPKAPAAPKPT